MSRRALGLLLIWGLLAACLVILFTFSPDQINSVTPKIHGSMAGILLVTYGVTLLRAKQRGKRLATYAHLWFVVMPALLVGFALREAIPRHSRDPIHLLSAITLGWWFVVFALERSIQRERGLPDDISY